MSMLKEAFEAGKFGVTAEMAPPKGYDFSEQLEAAKLLNGKVHGVNVTDMQSASLKASSLGLCVALKNAGIEPILQMTGRDRNRMAIMGDILSAAAFGIDTMLALTGDHPVVGDCPESKPVYDLDSVGILKMLTKMEQTNCDCGGNEIAGGAPKFYKGASVTPVYDPIELQINKLRQKVENGAEYIQTQGIFDLETFKRFLDKVDAAGIKTHIMAGIIPLKAAGMARYMNENVPGIAVPPGYDRQACRSGSRGQGKGCQGSSHAARHRDGSGDDREDQGRASVRRRPYHGHRRRKERPGHPRKGRRYDLSFLSYISASNRPNGLPEFRYKTII